MPHFAIANRNPLTQPAIVRSAAPRETAAIAGLLLRANRDYRSRRGSTTTRAPLSVIVATKR
jgi:hypothetical protein